MRSFSAEGGSEHAEQSWGQRRVKLTVCPSLPLRYLHGSLVFLSPRASSAPSLLSLCPSEELKEATDREEVSVLAGLLW